MADSKIKKILPKLFKRGSKDFYYFRRNVNGHDKWISTGTPKLAEAREAALKYIEAELSINAVSRVESSAHRLADTYVESLTGRKNIRTPVKDLKIWISHFPRYNDVTEGSRRYYHSIFNRFQAWCEEENIESIEAVDHSGAVRYSKNLWESGLGGKAYNDHLKHLSRVFSTLDAIHPLPHGDPLHHRKIARRKKSEAMTEGHHALEPEILEKVLAQSALISRDYRDLFVIGCQTGMRLKDAALLKWDDVKVDFIEISPYKTKRSGNTARIPISPTLRPVLDERKIDGSTGYILPGIAEHYLRNPDYVTKTCKGVFEDVLGKENTVLSATGHKHRKRDICIYSFHSLRTTFMSILASKDVSTRDAMRMMGWESPEMIKVYERILEKARGDADKRALDLVNNLAELKFKVPAMQTADSPLKPTAKALRQLVASYSNCTIGKIYGMSNVAAAKWMKKLGITRGKRIESATVDDDALAKIREELRHG